MNDQLTLLGGAPRVAAGGVQLAGTNPIAQIALDVGLPHLDRAFDYAVPVDLAESAVPGARVRVRFAGKDVGGFVIARTATADHQGTLQPIRRVVSPEPVLTPALLSVCRRVAQVQGGVLADVLRLAIPPRHARAEGAVPAAGEVERPSIHTEVSRRAWSGYPAGEALLDRLESGESLGAAWLARPCAAPEQDWPAAIAELAAVTLSAGRGVLVVLPDYRDVDRVAQALDEALGADTYVRLTADQGPEARYKAFLRALRGQVQCVIGTRAASYAPVHDLGLVVCWDDGDDLHAEPRAPYAHVREVARVRSEVECAALVMGGFTRSVAVQQWVEDDVVRPVDPAIDRGALPRVDLSGSEFEVERHGPAALARLPALAWQAAKQALETGPVLVQVPRRGYLPATQCAVCRAPARCETCHGPIMLGGAGERPKCGWCGREVLEFRCPECESTTLRAAVVGARRTAEELGRAFPGVPVIRSGGDEVIARVGADPALVISTPGAEPVADGGYGAVLLLDPWAMLDRTELDAPEQALRRWVAAAALSRSRSAGGRVVLAGARDQVPAVQALIRWAPGWFAERELSDRAQLDLPPVSFALTVTGPRQDVQATISALPDWLDRLGMVRLPTSAAGRSEHEQVRVVLRCPRKRREEAAHVIHDVRASRSLRKLAGDVAVRPDPDGSTL